jgi:hypothetical protein
MKFSLHSIVGVLLLGTAFVLSVIGSAVKKAQDKNEIADHRLSWNPLTKTGSKRWRVTLWTLFICYLLISFVEVVKNNSSH